MAAQLKPGQQRMELLMQPAVERDFAGRDNGAARHDFRGASPLTLQGTGLWSSLLGRLFCFSGKVGGEPVDDTALECAGAVAGGDQIGGHPGADELIGIGIVSHDVAIAREVREFVVRHPDRTGQFHRAVFVWVLEAHVEQERTSVGVCVVEPGLQIFASNAGDRHGRYSGRAISSVSRTWR